MRKLIVCNCTVSKKMPKTVMRAEHCRCSVLQRGVKGIKRHNCALLFVYLLIYFFVYLFYYFCIHFFSGCPLVSCKQELANEIASLDQADREVICGTLFHTINWFREVHVSIWHARCLNKISSDYLYDQDVIFIVMSS